MITIETKKIIVLYYPNFVHCIQFSTSQQFFWVSQRNYYSTAKYSLSLAWNASSSKLGNQPEKEGKCSLSITFHTYSSCARKYIFSGPASLNYKLKECCLPLLMWQNRELHILDLIYLLNWLSCSKYMTSTLAKIWIKNSFLL